MNSLLSWVLVGGILCGSLKESCVDPGMNPDFGIFVPSSSSSPLPQVPNSPGTAVAVGEGLANALGGIGLKNARGGIGLSGNRAGGPELFAND